MKEHPDYKYRPRRKPKTLVKSPPSSGQTNGSHHNNMHNGSSNNLHHNNNNDSRSSNNNLHHHSMKSTSPIISNHLHHSHHATGKYPFGPTIELPLPFPSSQHSQQAFAAGMHYPLVDPTLALDLQARLQAMYAGVYYPWRFGCSPLITSSSSPPQSGNIYAVSPKISPTTTTNSPPLDPDTQTSII